MIRVIFVSILILSFLGLILFRDNSKITLTNVFSIAAVLIAFGALILGRIDKAEVNSKLKLFDRPKIAFMDAQLIPYKSGTADYFKAKREQWGPEPLIFPTQSKSLFDHGKYDLLSISKNGTLRLQGQLNFINKGALEAVGLSAVIQPYFNGGEIPESGKKNTVNLIYPQDTFNLRFVSIIPKQKIGSKEERIAVVITLKYKGPDDVEYNDPPIYVIYDPKINNWFHASENDIKEIKRV